MELEPVQIHGTGTLVPALMYTSEQEPWRWDQSTYWNKAEGQVSMTNELRILISLTSTSSFLVRGHWSLPLMIDPQVRQVYSTCQCSPSYLFSFPWQRQSNVRPVAQKGLYNARSVLNATLKVGGSSSQQVLKQGVLVVSRYQMDLVVQCGVGGVQSICISYRFLKEDISPLITTR